MPLISCKPVDIIFRSGYTSTKSEELLHWLKSTPMLYHDVFSYPEKWFHLNIVDVHVIREVKLNYPKLFKTIEQWCIIYLFNSDDYDDIPTDLPFNINRWNSYIKNSFCPTVQMSRFAGKWIDKAPSEDREILIKELFETWKLKRWFGSMKPEFLNVLNAFGKDFKKYYEILKTEYQYSNSFQVIGEDEDDILVDDDNMYDDMPNLVVVTPYEVQRIIMSCTKTSIIN